MAGSEQGTPTRRAPIVAVPASPVDSHEEGGPSPHGRIAARCVPGALRAAFL